jgi:hypothetical protein
MAQRRDSKTHSARDTRTQALCFLYISGLRPHDAFQRHKDSHCGQRSGADAAVLEVW